MQNARRYIDRHGIERCPGQDKNEQPVLSESKYVKIRVCPADSMPKEIPKGKRTVKDDELEQLKNCRYLKERKSGIYGSAPRLFKDICGAAKEECNWGDCRFMNQN